MSETKVDKSVMIGVIIASIITTVGCCAAIVIFGEVNPFASLFEERPPDPREDPNKTIEIMVVQNRFSSRYKEKLLLYDLEVYVTCKRRYKSRVKSALKRVEGTIQKQLTDVFDTAKPQELMETSAAKINGEISEIITSHIGNDPRTNEPMVDEVLVSKMMPYTF